MNRIIAGHGGASTFALATTLEELGQPYTISSLDLSQFEQWDEGHRRHSAAGEPVVLLCSGLAMDNPLLAMLYLAEAADACDLLSQDPADTYQIQAVMAQLMGQMSGPLAYLGWHSRTPQTVQRDYLDRLERHPQRPVLSGWSAVWRDAVPEDQRASDARAKVDKAMAMIAARLANNAWLVGARFSLADIMAFALLREARTVLDGVSAAFAPAMGQWFAAMERRHSVSAAQRRIQLSGLDTISCAPVFA